MTDWFKAERERSYELYANEFALTRDSEDDEPHGLPWRRTRLNKTEVKWFVSMCCKAIAAPKTQPIYKGDETTWGDPYPSLIHIYNNENEESYRGQCSKCKGIVNFETYKTNITKNNNGD